MGTEEPDHERIQNDVGPVIGFGVRKSEEPRVERPAQISNDQGFLARKVGEENCPCAFREGRFVVAISMVGQDCLIIEVNEGEIEALGVEKERADHEPEQPGCVAPMC